MPGTSPERLILGRWPDQQIAFQFRKRRVILEHKGPAMVPGEGHLGNVGLDRKPEQVVMPSPDKKQVKRSVSRYVQL